MTAKSQDRVPRTYLPCRVGEAPHKFGPWRVFKTGRGLIESRTCSECGNEQQRDDAD